MNAKIILGVLILLGLPAIQARAIACPDDPNKLIDRYVAIVNESSDQSAKTVAAEDLSSQLSKLSPAQIEKIKDDSVLKMAELLDGRSEGIKVSVAEALGHLGYRAASAIPALQKASDAPEKPVSGIIMSSVPTSFFMKKAINDIKEDIDRRHRGAP